jgi:hypothetical protein
MQGGQSVVVERLLSEHDDYLSAKKAMLKFLDNWKADPDTAQYPVAVRVDGDYLKLHTGQSK